jgi:hypothetical protein
VFTYTYTDPWYPAIETQPAYVASYTKLCMTQWPNNIRQSIGPQNQTNGQQNLIVSALHTQLQTSQQNMHLQINIIIIYHLMIQVTLHISRVIHKKK